MEGEGNIVQRSSRYFAESVEELKKVSSPTRQETVQATIVTTFIVVLVATVVALMDVIFGQIMRAVLS
jgi:preprotein translocase SecE subunit